MVQESTRSKHIKVAVYMVARRKSSPEVGSLIELILDVSNS